MLFLIVDGVPSMGVNTLIGSGSLGTQPINAVQALPSSVVVAVANTTTSSTARATGTGTAANSKSGASGSIKAVSIGSAFAGLLAVFAMLM